MYKKYLVKVILISLTIFIIFLVVGFEIWRHFVVAKMFKCPSYVKLKIFDEYIYNVNGEIVLRKYREFEIKNNNIIKNLWESMDFFNLASSSPCHDMAFGENKPFAILLYPTNLKIEGKDDFFFEYPIMLFPDGRSFWNIVPDSDATYYTPQLTQYVKNMIINIDSQGLVKLIDTGSEKVIPSFQESINIGIDSNTPGLLEFMQEER